MFSLSLCLILDNFFSHMSIHLELSGDILQEFLISIFGKLEKGESCDDDFELNTILQVSKLKILWCVLILNVLIDHFSWRMCRTPSGIPQIIQS